MADTQVEVQAGAAAFKTYLDQMLVAQGVGWEEAFIPDNIYAEAAQEVITASDGSADQSSAARVAAGAAALLASVTAAGQGSRVTPTNCQEASAAILTAVAKVRAQENPPAKPSSAPAVQPVVAQQSEDAALTDQVNADDNGQANYPPGGDIKSQS
jgi:hypothetical protein